MTGAADPRLRARHDAGNPRYARRRLLAATGVLVVLAGLSLVAAGAARIGPLNDLGWTEQSFPPVAVREPGPGAPATELEVGFRWDRPDSCYRQPQVSLFEHRDRVEVRAVLGMVPRFGFLARSCTHRSGRTELSFVHVSLTDPLRRRLVVDGAGKPLSPGTP
jgi:hypothetical protein